MVYDSIGIGGLGLGSTGVAGNVVEKLVTIGLTQSKEFAAMVVAGSLGGENEVGIAADSVRIVASAGESDERCAFSGDPRIFKVIRSSLRRWTRL